MEAADRYFDEICAGVNNTTVAEIYRDHPDVKVKHWQEIRAKVTELIGTGDDPDLAKRLRHEWAESTDQLASTLFYVNLDADERETFAKYTLDSDLATQDRVYYFSMPYDYTFASVLGSIILNGWVGPKGSKKELKKILKMFTSNCQDYYQFVLQCAYRKREGREITEEDKEAGKSVYYMKEFGRRALAGEEIFDE